MQRNCLITGCIGDCCDPLVAIKLLARAVFTFAHYEPIISNGESSCARVSKGIDSRWKLGLIQTKSGIV